jgi:anti-sigma B factor antagonist
MPDTSPTEVSVPARYRIASDIDMGTAAELRPLLSAELREHGMTLVLDLEAVQFIDSTGLGMLVSLLKEARQAGGTVRLTNLSREVMRLFQITGLEQVFEIGEA